MSSESERLMQIDDEIWSKHGWTHKGMVNFSHYKKELRAKIGKKKYSEKVYDELENENFHTLNEGLVAIGKFEQPFQKRMKMSYAELNRKYPSGYADSRKKLKKMV
jgi:hypothetical protein